MSTRDQLVEAAADLLQRRGYTGTGMAEVLAESGTTKGSLYFHFPGGKEELAGVALRHRGSTMAAFISHLLDSSPDSGTAVAAFAAALAARLVESDYERGCALATATLDAATESPVIRASCADGYDSWLSLLASRLETDGWAPDEAADEAVLTLSALEGALVLARAQQDPAPLHSVGRMLARRLTPAR
ncbi:TetR/AcrR family transcriptional regulator [Rhodococcus sp. UNC363MFTsu5.1]|uniref:TetR/AcrR family transcriptional regulator n=1 Tax=Rhodococcus sp. UNC363MFTsu5.1 TaxID=1449069 RepID=UPI0004800A93|nr:TetR/AcrR family transcriptional regulator [Rhodococcus sp. UNC363MFTsu5.1]